MMRRWKWIVQHDTQVGGLGAMEDSWLGLHNYGRKSSILAKGG